MISPSSRHHCGAGVEVAKLPLSKDQAVGLQHHVRIASSLDWLPISRHEPGVQDVALTLRDRQRVVVIGNSGSGKSYFAQALAAQHDAPVLDLDTVFWLDGSYQAKRPAAAVAAILQQWRAKGRWIIEGVYGDLVEPFLPRAGLLVWLALPWADCARSLLEREFECRPLRTPQVDKAFDALMVYGAAYDLRTNGISRTAHQRLFDRFEGTKFTFESREEVDRFLGGLAASTP